MFLRIFVLLLLASNVFAQTGTLKIVSNASGTLKIDGEDKGSIDANAVKKIELKSDNYIIQFFPTSSNNSITKEVTIQIGKSETINFEVSGSSHNKIIPENNSNPLNIEMAFVEGGSFTMGCTEKHDVDCYNVEKPAHNVRLSSYFIGKYEVTQALWRAVMDTNPSYFKNCNDCPVESISWDDIQLFLQKLNQQTGKNYRLPTEAEWEFAARGGTNSRGYEFSGSNNIDSVTFYSNGFGKTFPVGQKQSNELGLYDMSGNVWECCSDWFEDYNKNYENNPKGPTSGSFRVIRGGGWSLASQYCRVSFRGIFGSGYAHGFRLAHDH
jgi:sulfatase modifying factor 1